MYHERAEGQVEQRYRLRGGLHARGRATFVRGGDVFHPTEQELQQLKGKIVALAADAPVEEEEIEDTDTVEEWNPEDEVDEDEWEDDPTEAFASEAAYDAWVEAGEPDLGDWPRTGYNGEKWNASDVRGFLAAQEDDEEE